MTCMGGRSKKRSGKKKGGTRKCGGKHHMHGGNQQLLSSWEVAEDAALRQSPATLVRSAATESARFALVDAAYLSL